mmetsp:Transcript_105003/g.185990  ORF Transcript_105003/g.185990 Transcript_105003/m.185990 type:complete len:212 (-) Transcript_105003:134-769(-)
MHKQIIALVLACLACLGCGRRTQSSIGRSQNSRFADLLQAAAEESESSGQASNQLEVLARLLVPSKSSAAFHLSGPAALGLHPRSGPLSALQPVPRSGTVQALVKEFDTKKEFESAIAQDSLVVVDYTRKLCGPCKLMNPKFNKIAEEFANDEKVTFYKADSETNLEMKVVHVLQGVRMLPTFDLFKNGQKVATVAGIKEQELIKAIKTHM